MYIGSWKIDDLLTFYANTTRFDTGAATDSDSVPSYHVYEDETATPLLTGTMALLNGNNTIGFYSEQITLSAANGFEKGKQYAIYKQATVNSVIGAIHDTFQIEAEVDANTVSTPVGINTGTFLDALSDKVWDELLSGHLLVGSAGHTLFSRMPTGTVLVGDKTGFSLLSPQSVDIIGNISGTITNVLNVINPVVAGVVTGSVLGSVNGSVNSVTQPVGISTGGFINAIADQVWDEAISGHLLVGSTGEKLYSRMPSGTVLIGDKTGFSLSTPQSFDLIGNISGTMTNVLNVVNPVVAGVVTGSVLGNVNGSVASVTNPVGISTGSFINAIADQVWDETLSGHLSAGSAGSSLNGAGSAGDPWTTALPGAYGAGTAGQILASRMPTGTVIVSSNQDKTGYSLSSPQNINIVGNISGTFVGNISGQLSDITSTLGNKIADHVLRRPYASARQSSDGDALSFRSLLGAIGKLVNRWKITGTTLTVYQEDDATATAPGGTQALTGTAGADPITEVDTS